MVNQRMENSTWQNTVKTYENLAKDVEDVFGDANLSEFEKRFPQFVDAPDRKTLMNLTETDLDALIHYYGQALSQKKYGSVNTILAGLMNEIRGTYRRNKLGGTIVDLINNMSAVSPDFSGEQADNLLILEKLMGDENYTPSNEEMTGFLQHGLDWTVDPPKREKY